jgi:pyrroline-5-carboxylate reductase
MHELALIGAGNMAEAIARGLLRGDVLAPEQMIAADVSAERRHLFAQQLKIACVDSPAAAASQASTLLLAVKPQQMATVLEQIGPVVRPSALVISIAAGIGTVLIERFLGRSQVRIVRAMPNTPMLAGEGMVVLSRGPRATDHDISVARRLFEPAATVIELPEEKLDAVTALSGSAPAYFFYLVEQMIRSGMGMGLSPDDSRTLAVRTAVGVGRMLATSSESVEQLRRRVTSPGGTTEAAISHMQENKLDHIVIGAIKSAQARARELGQRSSL